MLGLFFFTLSNYMIEFPLSVCFGFSVMRTNGLVQKLFCDVGGRYIPILHIKNVIPLSYDFYIRSRLRWRRALTFFKRVTAMHWE